MKKRFLHKIGAFISLALFILALWVLYHKLRHIHVHDVFFYLHQTSLKSLVFAIILTVLNYFVLSGYDVLALRYLGCSLPYPSIATASFLGFVFSQNTTFVGGGLARYRIYSSLGLEADQITRLIMFCSVTFWLGFFTVAGVVFCADHKSIPSAFHLPFNSVRPLGVLFLFIAVLYLCLIYFRKKPVLIHDWKITPPSLRLSLFQVLIAAVDWTLAASVFYVLFAPYVQISFIQLTSFFMLAQIGGLISSVPAGLGVFESLMLILLSGYGQEPAIVSSLLVYRLVYYLFPFGIGALLLLGQELYAGKKFILKIQKSLQKIQALLVPNVLSFLCFLAGVILLFSGALPAEHGRMEWLRPILPLPAIELSHFLGSIAGVCLLLLARGLQRRLISAWHIAIGLLFAGILFSLLKGADYEEAIILSVFLLLFIPCRKEFYRKTSLLLNPFSPLWVLWIGLILACTIWLGLFAYRHVDYSHELWWRFAFDSDAPRFMRAAGGIVVTLLIYGIWAVLFTVHHKDDDLHETVSETIKNLVSQSPDTEANLALLGDKHFLFNEAKNAFIMYARQGRYWIAMSDPVGPRESWTDLLWKFREICDAHSAWPVFYQVHAEALNYYIDIGMVFYKLGEEAHVSLSKFSLEGPANKNLRYAHNKLKDQCVFSVLPPPHTTDFLSVLREISDAWLSHKNAKEKGFSVGFFNTDYLQNFPIAVIRMDNKIIAFTNLWRGAEKHEISIDLMRYRPNSPNGIMDYLLIELMRWGKEEGYHQFNLGMAPMSGIESRPQASFWMKASFFLYQHGEAFYNFQGLRNYKEKFHPDWQPKYLACPKGFMLPHIAAGLTMLISNSAKLNEDR